MPTTSYTDPHYQTTTVQVRRGLAIFYPHFEMNGVRGGGVKGAKRDANLARSTKDYNGYLSKKAVKKIGRTIDVLIDGKKQRNREAGKTTDLRKCLTFTTLTLSDNQKYGIHTDYWHNLQIDREPATPGYIRKNIHFKEINRISDNYIKRNLFGRFMTEIKRKYPVKNVVWKAEKQKNGRIHFHILADTPMRWRFIRDLWNKIQDDYGYLENYQKRTLGIYKDGFCFRNNWNVKKGKKMVTKPLKEQLAYYKEQKKRGFKDANSTDIHSLQKVNNVASYITKEFAKKQQFGVGGRLWGCSKHLHGAKYYSEISEGENNDYWETVWREGKVFYSDDIVKVISLKNHALPEKLIKSIELHCASYVN